MELRYYQWLRMGVMLTLMSMDRGDSSVDESDADVMLVRSRLAPLRTEVRNGGPTKGLCHTPSYRGAD